MWDPTKNAQCAKVTGFHKFVYCTNCCDAKYAIDDIGRLFAWGHNYEYMCGLPNEVCTFNQNLYEVLVPTLISPAKNWVKVCGGEYAGMAMNNKGELYGWGSGYPYLAPFGLPKGSTIYDRLPRPSRVAPGWIFKDFSQGWYATYGIGLDNKLYAWGANYEGEIGADVPYSTTADPNSNYYTPIRVAIEEDVKLVNGELYVGIAATVDDKVYLWGELISHFMGQPDPRVPTQFPGLVIPPGETVVQVGICWSTAAVLLSDGSLWVIGDEASAFFPYPNDPWWITENNLEWSKVPLPEGCGKILDFRIEDFTAFVCWDDRGNLWFAGWADWSNGRPDPWCDVSDYGLQICCADFPGQRRYINAQLCGFNDAHECIDANGFLYSWGNNTGGKLGVGISRPPLYSACTPQLCSPAVDTMKNQLGLNILRTTEISPPEQIHDHDPCGHWHLERPDGEEIPHVSNCWEISLDVTSDGKVSVFATGHWWPFQVVFLEYNISQNTWEWKTLQGDQWRGHDSGGGSKSIGDFRILYNGKNDATGTSPFNYELTNPGMGCWMMKGTDFYTYMIDGANYESGFHRVGASSLGRVAIACRFGTTIEVRVSEDWGRNWLTKLTMTNANLKDYHLSIGPNGRIYVAWLLTTGAFYLEYSDDGGTVWTTSFNGSYPINGIIEFNMASSETTACILLFKSATTEKWYSLTYPLMATTGLPGTLMEVSGGVSCVHAGGGAIKYCKKLNDQPFYSAKVPITDIRESGSLGANDLGIYTYSHFGLKTGRSVAFLSSEDYGANWTLKEVPLSHMDQPGDFHEDPCDSMFNFIKENKDAWVKTVPKWSKSGPKITMPKYGGDNDVSGC